MPETGQAARYREIKRLGAGGMATVTLAEDTVLGRLVALKRVYSHGDSRGALRLKREAMVGASLNHPNLVFVYDAQLQEGGDVVIVMEYVDGETLADVIRARGAIPRDEAMRVLQGVAAALDAIHEHGIVHRDVKPANILLGRNGAVKLADLGVADVADRTRITTSDALVGSFSYMAPEQLDGAPTSPAVDVYALAAVAYEMLSGEKARPESNPLALVHAIATQPPPDLRQVSPGASRATAEVLKRGMSADPGQRPPSAGELVRRLESTFEPRRAPRTARTPPPPAPARDPRGRRSILAPILLGLMLLAVCAVAVAAIASSGGGGKKSAAASTSRSKAPARAQHRARSASTASRPATTTTSHQATTSPSGQGATTASSRAAPTTSASTPTPAAAAPPPAASSPAGPGSAPVATVEQFYEEAAQHRYAPAWALADPNAQRELGGYSSFQNTFSSVRSITFHSAQLLPGSTADAATVALRTTSVQTDRTQQCAGTARMVRSGGAWLLDGISIRCS